MKYADAIRQIDKIYANSPEERTTDIKVINSISILQDEARLYLDKISGILDVHANRTRNVSSSQEPDIIDIFEYSTMTKDSRERIVIRESLSELGMVTSKIKKSLLLENVVDIELLSSSILTEVDVHNTALAVFISYSRVDADVANNLASKLKEKKISHFLDQKDVTWGDSVRERIQQGLLKSSHIIVIVSPASLKSGWVSYEIGFATAKEKKILPFLTHQSIDLPGYIGELHYKTDIDDIGYYFEEELEKQETK